MMTTLTETTNNVDEDAFKSFWRCCAERGRRRGRWTACAAFVARQCSPFAWRQRLTAAAAWPAPQQSTHWRPVDNGGVKDMTIQHMNHQMTHEPIMWWWGHVPQSRCSSCVVGKLRCTWVCAQGYWGGGDRGMGNTPLRPAWTTETARTQRPMRCRPLLAPTIWSRIEITA